MFKNVVVGVDGKEGGRDAIALAKWLREPGGELTFAHVYPGASRIWRVPSVPYDAVELERTEELLETARKDAAVDAQLRWHVASTVGRGLHELSEQVGADLLVVGSRSYGPIGRLMHGSTAQQLARTARCPLLVLTRAAREADAVASAAHGPTAVTGAAT